MAIKEVDCRGLACPQPVISAKKALDSMDRGTVVVVVDNETARENVTLFARNCGCGVEVEKDGGNYRIAITRGSPGEPGDKPGGQPAGISGMQPGGVREEYRPREGRPSAAYLITSNLLGQGSPDLGQVLMKSLMVSLNAAERPPRALLFLNSGVMLTCQGSPVLEQILSLASRGTEVISCGTCLDYYKLKDRLEAGRVGNMLEINGHMAEGGVITIA